MSTTETKPTARQRADEFARVMQCNCDLDNWEPERDTGHSCVCRIHKTAVRPTYRYHVVYTEHGVVKNAYFWLSAIIEQAEEEFALLYPNATGPSLGFRPEDMCGQ